MISTYILEQKAELHPLLTTVYQELKALLPNAQEKISYGMPTFWQGQNIIHFAVHKKHLGLYPGPRVIEHFSNQLTSAGYRYTKGAIQFPYKQELPLELIKAITREALKENGK